MRVQAECSEHAEAYRPHADTRRKAVFAQLEKAPRAVAIVGFVLLMLGGMGKGVAGPAEDASAAYGLGDYATALQLLLPLAQGGNAGAQHNLGVMYSKGEGVPKNDVQAAFWFSKAAEQGFAASRARLARLYETGVGVPQNYREAAKWCLLAAEQGDAAAQLLLGLYHEEGRIMPRDVVQAYKWFYLAATRASDDEGRMWARAGRDRISVQMSKDQIAQAQGLAQAWRAAH